MKNLLYVLIALGVVSTSCTVTKRKYLSGYSVQWKTNFNTQNNTVSDEVKDSIAPLTFHSANSVGSLFLGSATSSGILDSLKKHERTTVRLYFFRQWRSDFS